ncbi:TadE/TadG family type IV pilus assembly protein [Candidatus Liberibacter asiaticus]|uniref:TadE-like domain-containing protein n=4 Tax=Liberibacter asiaticus TaxID=34021 RepID=C6XF91_LIBAP|nr:TadE/TadG family type IV pilus assembly protein [Candidatus Liberibacter asiaticus]ACT57044.1 hypothetical protein CLIBASIA_02290 [Candidatus Liberibacter asiaticus str. psy62]AGH16991.1 hypothetical protein WSI_03105 [Candidatus Liberibacter asiaticus str. gxpsy]ALK07326.1 pilus assembly protein [Candidatus Liberibacter asiaticus]ASK52817.1 hypothetical protein B2I23_03185 [Candidatus Liberibacter asiaticus]AWL14133.1 hypothetical protein DIC79_03210 [Candidatus Liberibacter asiaticus]
MKCIKNYILRFLSRENGVVAVEMAIILPILLLIYMAVYEITMLYTLSKRLTRFASHMGDMVAQETSINKQYLQGFENFLRATMYPYRTPNHSIIVTGYWLDNKQIVRKMWNWSSSNVKVEREDIPASIKDASTFIVRAEVSINYRTLVFSKILPDSLKGDIVLRKVYYYRQRLGDQIVCRDC